MIKYLVADGLENKQDYVNLSSLTKLDLSNCPIDMRGIEFLADLLTSKSLKALTTLNLMNCTINDAHLLKILQALQERD